MCVDVDSMFVYCVFFFFKQKTAYEMRISDWSSDVCSSDLILVKHALGDAARHLGLGRLERRGGGVLVAGGDGGFDLLHQRADARHAVLVDDRSRRVAADALLCLRRIGHNFLKNQIGSTVGATPKTEPPKPAGGANKR